MFEGVSELAFVSASIFHDKYSKSFHFILLPFAYVTFPFRTCPHTTASFTTAMPLPIIHFTIAPLENPSAMSDTFYKIALKVRTIRIVFMPRAMFKVIFELTFVYFTREVKDSSFSMFLALLRQLSEIYSVLIFFYLKVRMRYFLEKIIPWSIVSMYPVNIWCSKGISDRMNSFSICWLSLTNF